MMQAVLYTDSFKEALMNRKIIVQAAAFLAVLGILFYHCYHILGYHDDVHSSAVFQQFYDLDEDLADVIWLGPSATQEFIIPTVMYDETGLALYSLSVGNEPFMASESLIRECERVQDPQLYLVDIRHLAYMVMDDTYIRRVTDNMEWSVNRFHAVKYMLGNLERYHPGTADALTDYIFSFTKYHTRLSGEGITKNLYGPNDNFHLENSHVLPAMIRKVHLAKLLGEGRMDMVRADLALRPVSGLQSDADDHAIEARLAEFGIYPGRVKLWGTGTPLREFLWSEDMADACVHILLNVSFNDIIKDRKGEIRNTHINIGTGKELSIAELASLVADAVGFEGTIEWDASKPDGTMRKLCSVERLHRLGWHHSVELPDGIKRLYSWYKEH